MKQEETLMKRGLNNDENLDHHNHQLPQIATDLSMQRQEDHLLRCDC